MSRVAGWLTRPLVTLRSWFSFVVAPHYVVYVYVVVYVRREEEQQGGTNEHIRHYSLERG